MNENSDDLSGMTVNERLFATGLLSEFDDAVARRDLIDVRRILEFVRMDEISLEKITENIKTSGSAAGA